MEIRVGENESLESALKRFKRKCARSGVLAEVRRREHYEKPSVKRKKKAEAAGSVSIKLQSHLHLPITTIFGICIPSFPDKRQPPQENQTMRCILARPFGGLLLCRKEWVC